MQAIKNHLAHRTATSATGSTRPRAPDLEIPASTPIRHLNQLELARRWRMSPRTLERWRSVGEGPVFLKLVGHVAYRMNDIEAFEAASRHTPIPVLATSPEKTR